MRVVFYLFTGIALAGACTWYVQSLVQAITGRGEVVIAPFEMLGSTAPAGRGTALAHMLHARLGEIERDIRVAQSALTAPKAAPPKAAANASAAGDMGPTAPAGISMPQLLTQPVELRAGLLEPADINVSVGGVQVGGVVAWMQRLVSQPRTLTLTLYESKEGAQLSGSLKPLGMTEDGLRVEMPLAAGQETASLDRLVEQVAYEIIRQRLARAANNRVEVLSRGEFQSLVEVLRDTATLNRRVALGRGALPEFQELLGKVARLADEVPEWYQINYLAASVAESAKDLEAACKYFRRVRDTLGKEAGQRALLDQVKAQLQACEEQLLAATPPDEAVPEGGDGRTEARARIEALAQTATTLLNNLIGHRLGTPKVKIISGKGAEAMNSYWDGSQIVIPEAFEQLPDIVYREASWPHIMRLAGSGALDGDDGSTEAILYSYADVLPMLIQQSTRKEDAKTSRWELASGYEEVAARKSLGSSATRTPYLSFAKLAQAPGAAKQMSSQQVGHMRDFDTKSEPMVRKYINCGILNRAFYEAAQRLGTAKAGTIWIAALKQLKGSKRVDFPRFAAMLHDTAQVDDRPLLREALLAAGLDPQLKVASR